MKALQTLRPRPLHPYLVLAGSCPQPLSLRGHAGGAVPEPPLPPAAPAGRGAEGTGWGMDVQTCKYRVKREVPGQPPWPPALHSHRLCVTSVSLVWEYPGV